MNTKYILRAIEYARDGMFVPPELTKEILAKVKAKKDKSILVLFSYEMLPVLSELGYRNVTLAFDKPRKSIYNVAAYYGYKVVDIKEIQNMKFDVVIGNPPYQDTKEDGTRKSKTVNLWSKFVSLGISITKSNGCVAMITPNSWLSPSVDVSGEFKIENKDRLWDVFESYSTYANVIDVAQHFKGVGSTFGYFVVDKSGNSGLRFSDGANTSLGFLPKSGFKECLKRLSSSNNLSTTYRMDRRNCPGWRVVVPASRVLEESSIEILFDAGMPTTGSAKDETLYTYVYCNSKEECVKVRKKIVECLDILNTHCRWSGFINNQTLKMIKI